MSISIGGSKHTYESKNLKGNISVLKLSPTHTLILSFPLITMIEFYPQRNQAIIIRKLSIDSLELRKRSLMKTWGW